VVFVTDIVTPYYVAVFEALARLVELTVVFASRSSSRACDWNIGELGFRHFIVGGAALRGDDPDAMNYYLSPRILSAVARERPDAIVCAGFSVPTLYAAAYAVPRRVPFLIHSVGTPHSERVRSRAQRLSRALLLRLASAAVANSGQADERFRQLGVRPERIFRAPHSTNVAAFWPVAQGRPERSGLRILTVGRLIPRKGLDYLLDAVARASAGQSGIRLTLVGSGPEEQALRARAARLGIDVEFRGFVDQPALPAVYREADVFAFPTLDDPFGIVLLEAAAAGLPLVASPYAGATGDLVRHGEQGFIVAPQDVEGMAEAFLALARDPALRRRLGKAAHRGTLARTPEAAAAGYAAAISASLQRPGRARPLLT
jgi:glycosyltransferase involved in cell wall biosynthesis